MSKLIRYTFLPFRCLRLQQTCVTRVSVDHATEKK